MDFGTFDHDKRRNRLPKVKQIRVRPKTGDHDIKIKVKKAIGYLEDNFKVQIVVLFRGREMAQIEEGRKVMEHIIELLSEHGKIESAPSKQSRRMFCTIAPGKSD